jgi:tetratricopeptide (TPR) repeat protein
MRRVVLGPLVVALLAFSGPPSWAQQRPTSPTDFDQVAAQAEQARAANEIEEAIELYKKALSLRPEWAEGWWYLGTLFYERDAFADAAAAFEKAATLDPKAGTAWAMLGLCEFRLERYEAALEHIQKGRQLGTGAEPRLNNVLLYHEGLLLLGKGEFEQAREALGRLSEGGVEDENLTVALGLSALRMSFSDLLAGDSALRELVRRAGRAEHLAAQKKFDEALGEYERLTADLPKAPNVQYAYGRFLIASNQPEKAVDAFKREIENTPNHLLARLGVADTKFKLRDHAGGLPYAEQAVTLAPQSPLAHFLLGVLLFETGQTERAIGELEAAEKLLPNEPQVYFQLGRAYARANRKEDAARARATFARLSRQAEGGGGQGQPR